MNGGGRSVYWSRIEARMSSFFMVVTKFSLRIDNSCLDMCHSLQNQRHTVVWLLCLICCACFLTACETTEQMKARKAEDANLGVNKNAGGELSPPLEAANAAAEFLSSGAGFHGSF
jgi:hypothetical protein